MIREALSVPQPLKIGPVYVNGMKLEGSGTQGTALFLRPDAGGLQHCEIAGMQDTLEARVPVWLRRLLRLEGWQVKVRLIKPDHGLHPSVLERLALPDVPQCAGNGPYRPAALRNHPAASAFDTM